MNENLYVYYCHACRFMELCVVSVNVCGSICRVWMGMIISVCSLWEKQHMSMWLSNYSLFYGLNISGISFTLVYALFWFLSHFPRFVPSLPISEFCSPTFMFTSLTPFGSLCPLAWFHWLYIYWYYPNLLLWLDCLL
jgi:hypothetical protein